VIEDGRKRVVIENVKPEIDYGRFPAKRVVGEKVEVTADIFSDGHDSLSARLLYRRATETDWIVVPMTPRPNDRWQAEFAVLAIGAYTYTIEGWVDHFKTWQRDLKKKQEAGQVLQLDLAAGLVLIDAALRRAGEDREQPKLRAVRDRIERQMKKGEEEAAEFHGAKFCWRAGSGMEGHIPPAAG